MKYVLFDVQALSFIFMTTIVAGKIDIPEQYTTPILASKNPRRNFARLCQLIMTVCVDLFRDVLDFYIAPAKLRTEIRKNFDDWSTMLAYQNREILEFCISPWFPHEILPSKIFDLSLLYIAIRSICCIPQPTNGWGSSPETNDRSLAANIERIRIYGIKVLNDSEEFNDTNFQDIWRNLRTNIDEIQKLVFKKDTYGKAIDELSSHEQIPTRYIDRFQRLKGENFVIFNACLTFI